jgi:hypothetical protein
MSSPLLKGGAWGGSIKPVKAIIVAVFLSLSATTVMAEDWTTNDGMFYPNVRVIRVEDDAITIIYRDGGALVPLVKLPANLQKKFDYDPVKAKVAAEARTKADAENAHLLQLEIEKADQLRKADQIKEALARSGATNK